MRFIGTFRLAWVVLLPFMAGADMTLVRDGEALAVLVLPAEPAPAEQEAASELVDHIRLMTGVTLPLVHDPDGTGGRTPIRIGTAADEALVALIRAQSDDPWAFALVVDAQGVQLRGLSPEGTRTAAYELLEQLGVRWYMPGEIGRVVPQRATVALAAQLTVQTPSFVGRGGSRNHDGRWNERLRLGGIRRYGAHGMRPFHSRPARQRWFQQHPEYFALIDGERRPRQLCLTNSTDDPAQNQVLRLVVEAYREILRAAPETRILNMGPNDGDGYCECAHCRALDPPASVSTPLATPGPSYTDRYVWFFNHITEALSDEFPGIRIGFYAYANHLLPPVMVEPRDNLAVSLAPIHVCRLHGPNNPVCPESNFPRWAYEKWRPYAGDFLADRGYGFNLADPGFPHSLVHRYREEVPIVYALGVRIYAAASDAWASQNPSMYLQAKLLWDVDTDVDALLAEFYTLFYGPAAGSMAEWHALMDRTVRDADHHTGSIWDLPWIYPASMRAEARDLLAEAGRLAADADDPAFGTRVAIKTAALDFLDAYCDQRARRDAFDFTGARAAMERAGAARDRLVNDFGHPMLMPRHADSLFRRFVETPAIQDETSTGGNKATILARFNHEWQFQLDPEAWGQYLGLHRPESAGGNWRTIRTDTSWSNQGLRYYFGQAWYRQRVEVPAGFEDRPVHLWFSGVDSTAAVWVNGSFVGANYDGAEFDLDAFGSSFRPFQFDVSNAIRPGAPNIVTVRTRRHRTNEVGTGGIVGPVMFYLPGD